LINFYKNRKETLDFQKLMLCLKTDGSPSTKKNCQPAIYQLTTVREVNFSMPNIDPNYSQSQGDGIHGAIDNHHTGTLDARLRGMRKNAIRTLFGIACFSPQSVKTIDLAESLQQHRSTTSVHLVELEEVGVIVKKIESGTEKKLKPTYLYSLDPSVDKVELEKLFDALFPNSPLLGEEVENEYPDSVSDPDVTDPIDHGFSSNDSQTKTELTFESQIATIVNAMAAQIVSLQTRVADLESQLSVHSNRGATIDLSMAMNLLDSLNVVANGGSHD
jgi:predicted transcriptional regulator